MDSAPSNAFVSKAPGSNPGNLPGFNAVQDFPGNVSGNNRIGLGNPNNAMSSPAGSGILPPNPGLSDVGVGLGSSLGGNLGGNVGPVGSSQLMGGTGGFGSSIGQGLGAQFGSASAANSLGLSNMPSSSASGFGSSQFGIGGSQLTSGSNRRL